jgi:hypothetical protein
VYQKKLLLPILKIMCSENRMLFPNLGFFAKVDIPYLVALGVQTQTRLAALLHKMFGKIIKMLVNSFKCLYLLAQSIAFHAIFFCFSQFSFKRLIKRIKVPLLLNIKKPLQNLYSPY